MKKICIVTASRSEYGLLRWLIDDIYKDIELQLQLVVTGGHLSIGQGSTYNIIKQDGYPIDKCIEMLLDSDTEVGIIKSLGIYTLSLAEYFYESIPDLVIVLGDRYELLPVCEAALIMSIPIAHISGGDITEGAIDNKIRNAVTMMANIHFPGTKQSYDQIVRMLGHSENIFITGETNLDNFRRLPQLSKKELAESLNLDIQKKWILMTYHPVTTISLSENIETLNSILQVLESFSDFEIIVTKANFDYGGNHINAILDKYCSEQANRHLFISLGQMKYINCLRYIYCMIGNSSSGIFETPLYAVPTINVGNRQKGRLITNNILSVASDENSIREAFRIIETSIFKNTLKSVVNPYGDGHASERILSEIKRFLCKN